MGQVENNARYLRQMGYRIIEDIDASQRDFQTMLDELTDAKNSLVQHNGYMPRQWVFGLIPRVPGHMLENSDLPNLDPEGRFRKIAEMRHKCRMAAIETEATAKIRKSLIGRSRPMRGNYVSGDLVYHWRAGNGVHQAQGQWMGPARVIGIEGGNVWVSHRATAIKCAKEQLRMASPAEREMREMQMRIGGDDPDERSKHGVPRQQDLKQQQSPTQFPSQKTITTTVLVSITKNSKYERIQDNSNFIQDHRCNKMHQDRNQYMSVRSSDQIKNHNIHSDRNNEFECMMIHQQLMIDGGKRPRVVESGSQKMETDQVPESELLPVPEDDDLNATIIEVMTDVEVLLDGSSVIDGCICCELCATKTCRSQ